jgi:hypothetical protein
MENIKIRMPNIDDDPIIGRVLCPVPFVPSFVTIFHDYLIIENGILTIKNSIMSSRSTVSINLKKVSKILVKIRELPGWTKGPKYNWWGRIGTEIELSLVDLEGNSHILIPKFLLNNGQKEWNRFLGELKKTLRLPLEEKKMTP